MMILRLLSRISVVVVFISGILFKPAEAQKIVPSSDDLFTEAEEYMFAGDYKEALPVYLMLYDKGFTTPNINYRIGECLINIEGQKDKAIKYLEKAVTGVSSSYRGKDLTENYAPLKAYLYLGIAYRLRNEFEKARDVFNTMLTKQDMLDDQTRMLAEYNIRQCTNAEVLMKTPTTLEKIRLPEVINTPVPNRNPIVADKENTIYYMNQLKFYDAIMQAGKKDGIWQEPVNLTPVVKSDGDHLITGCSADGKTLLFSCYDPYKSGEIYSCTMRDGKWSPIKKLNNHINTQFNETHASLSPDGKTLYFTSDRKGGYGHLDLYKSQMINDDWGPAVNLGPVINTIFNEETPFMTSDARKLFFSSQGHYNMGGYDIFYSEWKDGTWTTPVNAGYPLNTTDDNLFYFPLDTGKTGYMSVIDESTRESDIYRFSVLKFSNPARYTLIGQVNLPQEQQGDITGVSVTFIEKDDQDTVASQSLDVNGKFKQQLAQGNYTIHFSDGQGNRIDAKEIYIPPFFPQDQLVLNTQLVLPVATLTPVPAGMIADTFFVENILFTFDKSSISTRSVDFLNSLISFLKQYPGLLLQITGHADAIGRDDYNMNLSRERAKAVAKYLTDRQIDQTRLTLDAKGEREPVAPNTEPDGSDNPEGRSLNRRVEIQLSVVPENWVIFRKELPVTQRH